MHTLRIPREDGTTTAVKIDDDLAARLEKYRIPKGDPNTAEKMEKIPGASAPSPAMMPKKRTEGQKTSGDPAPAKPTGERSAGRTAEQRGYDHNRTMATARLMAEDLLERLQSQGNTEETPAQRRQKRVNERIATLRADFVPGTDELELLTDKEREVVAAHFDQIRKGLPRLLEMRGLVELDNNGRARSENGGRFLSTEELVRLAGSYRNPPPVYRQAPSEFNVPVAGMNKKAQKDLFVGLHRATRKLPPKPISRRKRFTQARKKFASRVFGVGPVYPKR
jgi:hypothetical protein